MAVLCVEPEIEASFRRTEIPRATGVPVSVADKRLTDRIFATGAPVSLAGERLTDTWATGVTGPVSTRRTDSAVVIGALIGGRCRTDIDPETGVSTKDESRIASCA